MVQEPAPNATQPPAEQAPPSWDATPRSPEKSDADPATRRLVSVQRLHHALAFRLGCRATGDRGPGGSYWRTATGFRFLVNDPNFDRDSAAVMGADGRRQLFYSYKYAAALLYHVLWLNSGPRAVHGPSGHEPVHMRPSAEAMGVMLSMTEDILHEARAAARRKAPTEAKPAEPRVLDLENRIFI